MLTTSQKSIAVFHRIDRIKSRYALGLLSIGAAIELIGSALRVFRVPELKHLCRILNHKVGGRKQELVNRLISHFMPDTNALLFEGISRRGAHVTRSPGKKAIKVRLPKWQVYKGGSFCFCMTSKPDEEKDRDIGLRDIKCHRCKMQLHLSCVKSYCGWLNALCPLCIGKELDTVFDYADRFLVRPIIMGRNAITNSPQTTAFVLSDVNRMTHKYGRVCVSCVDLKGLENDPPRCRWPRFYKMRINGRSIEESCFFRSGTPARTDVTDLCSSGRNVVHLQFGIPHFASSEGPFLFLVYVSRKRSVEAVAAEIRRSSTESASNGRARTARMLRQEESDGIVVLQKPRISLRCPLGLGVMETPARGKSCAHLACFDLVTFLRFNMALSARNAPIKSQWKCPICSIRVKPKDLVCSAYVADILRTARGSQDVDDIDFAHVSLDGSWTLDDSAPTKSESSSSHTEQLNEMAQSLTAETCAEESMSGPPRISLKAPLVDTLPVGSTAENPIEL